MSTAELENGPLPDTFINVFRRKNTLECQTLDLVKLNQKIMDSHNEVVNMSDRSIQELIEDIRSEISPLVKVSEAIAILDMLAAFAQLVTTQEYVRPELTDVLAIKAGRHPIKEKIQSNKFVPNDAYAAQQSRFQIITGCNMSGKSTYIRSLALMTIMAQIGCFVPAQYASFPIVHQLFARVSTTDDIEANMSTFAAEMREVSFILRNIEPRSMVIIDELGRGTSTTDGLAIAIAIAEALVESHALVWFATHFRDLARIMSERCGVVSLHLAVELSPEASKMTMLYRIAEGHVQERFYGLALAKLVALPPKVLEVARTVSEKLTQIVEHRQGSSRAVAIARRRNLILRLKEQLTQAKDGNMEDADLKDWLGRLQEEFILQLADIDAEFVTSSDDEENGMQASTSDISESDDHSTEQMDHVSESIHPDQRDDSSDLLDDSPGLRRNSSLRGRAEE
ncbi:MutS protein msh4 [Paecilomyces lecythidis]|uniref:MutS protein msh4 n=1 Tax=Paecilomyces lecythidis TaxID=3004212 RepID=A0ABR3XEJ9_9EURO